MGKLIKYCLIIILGLYFFNNWTYAVELKDKGKTIIPDKINEEIIIDGILNEQTWKSPGLLKHFLTFSPLYGETLEHKTKIWIAYDQKNLFFAFKCFDTQPDKITTKIARRDTIASNDCVGVVIDTMNNKQSSYEFYINPNGIQEDGITSAVNGMNFDGSPDYVWESAGKLTKDGYIVEMKIPLKNIRFKSGENVEMGLIFMRNLNRLGKWGSWPEMKAGDSQFNAMLTVKYKNLKRGLKLEILPNLTYNSNQNRENVTTWEKSIDDKNIGASIKYGITSSISAEATINPDFSQIESDAFQMDVNQRYPVFYNEKRPFFMEGMEALDFGLINNGMMRTAVHTRKIIDPNWAVKLSGTIGKTLFTVLSANDGVLGQTWNSGFNPNEGKKIFWGIARAKYSLGSDNSFGFLYTGNTFSGIKNNVFGIDLQYRIIKNTRLKLSYLNSMTSISEQNVDLKGSGINAMVEYSTQKIDIWTAFEHFGDDFKMDTAFLNRNGINRFSGYFAPNFNLSQKSKFSWIRRIKPFLEISSLKDIKTNMYDSNLGIGIDMFMIKSGFFKIRYRNEKEIWLEQEYIKKSIFVYGQMQFNKWLRISTYLSSGDQIFYDTQSPFLGSGNNFSINVNLQPTNKFSFNLGYVFNDLKQKTGAKEKVYSVNIYNILSTYQFNKHFFLRTAIRYDNYNKKLMTDFLASYTLVPGTVAHFGYGLLFEDKKWEDQKWMPGTGTLINMRRNLFFKVSYLWRF